MNDATRFAELQNGGTIYVWQIQLDSSLNPAVNLDDFLSSEERNRAKRFAFARDAARFRVCRACLRLGLAWYLEKTPREVVLTTGKYGKPRLADPSGLYFNVTHAQDLGLIAFTTIGEIGVDVEAVTHHTEFVDIAAAYFTKNEYEMVATEATHRDQVRTFLRLWTRKEAALKAAGLGILRGLDTFDVSQPSIELVGLQGAHGESPVDRWLLRDLELPEGFVGAIAAPEGDWFALQRPVCAEELITRFEA